MGESRSVAAQDQHPGEFPTGGLTLRSQQTRARVMAQQPSPAEHYQS